LRQRFPQLRLTGWLSGAASGDEQPDVLWWHPAGRPMGISDWQSNKLGAFGLQLAPEASADTPAESGATLLCLINRDEIPVPFLLPPGVWKQLCDSSAQAPFASCRREKTSPVAARSVQLLSLE
jgi:hypothetical protein